MHCKKNTLISFIAIMYVLCFICTGCTSNRHRTGTESDILEHQRRIDELENTIRSYEAAIDDTVRALAELRNRAEDMGTTVDGVIELFGQYQRLVEQLLRNYYMLRNEIEKTKQVTEHTAYYNYYTYDAYDYRLRSLLEEYTCTAMAGYIAVIPEIENGYREKEKVWLD